MNSGKVSRRQLCGGIVLGAIVIPAITQESTAIARRLAVTDPEAVKLNYVEDAKAVDAKRFPNYKLGQTCDNCQLVQMRYGFWRPCKIVPADKLISAKGWCSAWVART
jgi:hypothetical protein